MRAEHRVEGLNVSSVFEGTFRDGGELVTAPKSR